MFYFNRLVCLRICPTDTVLIGLYYDGQFKTTIYIKISVVVQKFIETRIISCNHDFLYGSLFIITYFSSDKQYYVNITIGHCITDAINIGNFPFISNCTLLGADITLMMTTET